MTSNRSKERSYHGEEFRFSGEDAYVRHKLDHPFNFLLWFTPIGWRIHVEKPEDQEQGSGLDVG